MYVFSKETIIPKPPEQVFLFFNKPENLEQLTPKHLGFRILTPTPIEMGKGTLIDYSIQLFGLPMRWTTYISDYQAPYMFVDIQLKGPYRYWHHKHTFEALSDTQTKMTDTVHYDIGLGILGQLAHALFVKKQIQAIFAYRDKVLDLL